MEKREQDYIEIDLMHLLSKVWQHKVMVILVTLIFALGTLFVNLFLIAPKYQSTTRIYVVNQAENKAVTTQDLQLGNFLVKDYKEIILSDSVLTQIVESEHLNVTAKQLAKDVHVNSPKDTRILSISVSSKDPNEASRLANKIREVSAEQIKRITKVKEITTLEEAVPTNVKSSPKVKRNTALAVAVGLMLSIGTIILKELLDDRVHRPEDIEDNLGLILLGIVPNVATKE